MKNCCYCQDEATHVETDPFPPPEGSDRELKDRYYCNRHVAECLLGNKKARVNEILIPA